MLNTVNRLKINEMKRNIFQLSMDSMELLCITGILRVYNFYNYGLKIFVY